MNELPTTKSQSLAQFKAFLQSKHQCDLQTYDAFLRDCYSTTLKESLAANWNYLEIGYVSYFVTEEGIEDELKAYIELL